MYLEVQDDYIKLYLREIRCEEVDWNHLAQEKLSEGLILNLVMNYIVLQNEQHSFAKLREYRLLKKDPVPWIQIDAFFHELPNVSISVSNAAVCLCHTLCNIRL
jgi:hypothetical protein